MFGSLALALSALIFTSVITAIYFTKKKYNNIENNIYRILLIDTMIVLVFKFICGYTMYNREQIPMINEIACRMCILFTVLWFVITIAYMRLILSDIKYNSTLDFLNDKYVLGSTIICSLSFFTSCFLRMDFTSGPNNEYTVINGPAVSYQYLFFAFVSIFILVFIIRGLNKNNILKRLPTFLLLFLLFVMEIIEFLYADINALPFIMSICVVTIYFTIENQDSMLANELEKAKKASEQADKDKTEFLSKMSHEIRTPMNTIMGFSESLLDSKELSENEVKKDVKNIHNAGKNLLEIINNILVFSRIESGKEEIDEIEYQITDIIGELESYIYSRIDTSKVKFVININEDMPLNYFGDKLKVYRIVLNILNNSTKYTEAGSITLDVDFDKEEQLLKFKIVDTGTGMKEEDLNKLFREFNEDENVLNDSNGPGIGLAVVKKLSDMLSASISFKSEYGIGTEFNVSVKQKTVGDKLVKDNRKSEQLDEDIYFDCSKYSILIVDDNKLNLKVTQRLLEHYKVKFDSCENGKDCVKKIKSGKKYDLILLDHLMPELDGIETLRILKKLEIKLPPVIAMTANVVTELKETYYKEGFDDFLSKPVDIKELNKLMIKYFKKNTKKRGK